MEANDGLITTDDLAGYAPVEREVLHGTYRGFEILTMPPPSSGGIALIQMLHMLEPHDLTAMGFQGTDTLHLMTEAMRRAFRDRAEFPGDPSFVRVPVAGLTDAAYARGRMADFDPEHASRSETVRPGRSQGPRNPPTRPISPSSTGTVMPFRIPTP